MPLLLTEADVERLLRMEDLIPTVEAAFKEHGTGAATNRPRQRVVAGNRVLHVMAAGLPARGVMGFKAYASARPSTRFHVMLYSTETGELLAIIEADRLGQMRTGAASGVATRHMSRENAGAVGIIGTGWQAQSQLLAMAAVRPVALVTCYSRTPEKREAFADAMVQELGCEVVAVDTAQAAVEDSDIIVTATTSREPVLRGEWLRPGVHVNAVGANWAHRREIDAEVVRRSNRIAVDHKEQAIIEAGDLIPCVADGVLDWDRVADLGQVVTGQITGRGGDDEITLFCSQGIALEDVAAAALVYERARAAGVGREVAL